MAMQPMFNLNQMALQSLQGNKQQTSPFGDIAKIGMALAMMSNGSPTGGVPDVSPTIGAASSADTLAAQNSATLTGGAPLDAVKTVGTSPIDTLGTSPVAGLTGANTVPYGQTSWLSRLFAGLGGAKPNG